MPRKYWAARKAVTIGPFATLDAAIAAGRLQFAKPLTRDPRDRFMTGYGAFGPHFDMRFHGAAEKETV